MSASTPRPWRVEYEEPYEPQLLGPDGQKVKGVKLWEDDADYPGGDLNHTTRANARLLVHSVNMHEQLADAISYLLPIADAFSPTRVEMASEHQRRLLDIQALLIKARCA